MQVLKKSESKKNQNTSLDKKVRGQAGWGAEQPGLV